MTIPQHDCMLVAHRGLLPLPPLASLLLPQTSRRVQAAAAGDRCPLCELPQTTAAEEWVDDHWGPAPVLPTLFAVLSLLVGGVSLSVGAVSLALILGGVAALCLAVLLLLHLLKKRGELKERVLRVLRNHRLRVVGSVGYDTLWGLLREASHHPSTWQQVATSLRELQALTESRQEFGEVLSQEEKEKLAVRVCALEATLRGEASILRAEKRLQEQVAKREALDAHLAAGAALSEAATPTPTAALARVLAAPELASYPQVEETPGVFANYR